MHIWAILWAYHYEILNSLLKPWPDCIRTQSLLKCTGKTSCFHLHLTPPSSFVSFASPVPSSSFLPLHLTPLLPPLYPPSCCFPSSFLCTFCLSLVNNSISLCMSLITTCSKIWSERETEEERRDWSVSLKNKTQIERVRKKVNRRKKTEESGTGKEIRDINGGKRDMDKGRQRKEGRLRWSSGSQSVICRSLCL